MEYNKNMENNYQYNQKNSEDENKNSHRIDIEKLRRIAAEIEKYEKEDPLWRYQQNLEHA